MASVRRRLDITEGWQGPDPPTDARPTEDGTCLEIDLEFNRSAHHWRQMMMVCWWRWGWVWVRLGLTSNSKR